MTKFRRIPGPAKPTPPTAPAAKPAAPPEGVRISKLMAERGLY
jgi:hypothetical protein